MTTSLIVMNADSSSAFYTVNFFFFSVAELSEEKLKEEQVMQGALAELTFRFKAYAVPSTDQVDVEHRQGKAVEDVRFAFNASTDTAVVKFPVLTGGDYRVVVRLPMVEQRHGQWHSITIRGKTGAVNLLRYSRFVLRNRALYRPRTSNRNFLNVLQ